MAHLDFSPTTFSPTCTAGTPRGYARFGKRMLDLVLAAALLPVLAPLIAVLCLLARRDGAPGLFSHSRVGQHGRAFTCWKIRTMVPDAQAQLAHHLSTDPSAAAEWARSQKLTNDPRVTRLGRFLRRTSLDELPQIWNVLRGDMSFVGPRPITEGELARFGLHAQTYLSLKPGVTGVWQVRGRSNGCYEERLRMDQSYALRISLWRDLFLILCTAFLVVWPTGR
jgi:lipopolysaccharide/colanic/teichoic acid biosynthesis glycosyltransferase